MITISIIIIWIISTIISCILMRKIFNEIELFSLIVAILTGPISTIILLMIYINEKERMNEIKYRIN